MYSIVAQAEVIRVVLPGAYHYYPGNGLIINYDVTNVDDYSAVYNLPCLDCPRSHKAHYSHGKRRYLTVERGPVDGRLD